MKAKLKYQKQLKVCSGNKSADQIYRLQWLHPSTKTTTLTLLVGWFPTYNLKQLETSSAEIMSPPELVSTHFWLLIRPQRRAVSLEGTFQTEHDTRNRWSIPKGVACLRELRVNCLKLCKNFYLFSVRQNNMLNSNNPISSRDKKKQVWLPAQGWGRTLSSALHWLSKNLKQMFSSLRADHHVDICCSQTANGRT